MSEENVLIHARCCQQDFTLEELVPHLEGAHGITWPIKVIGEQIVQTTTRAVLEYRLGDLIFYVIYDKMEDE